MCPIMQHTKNFETKAVSDLVLEARHPLYQFIYSPSCQDCREHTQGFFFSLSLVIRKPFRDVLQFGFPLICPVSLLTRPNLESIPATVGGRRCTLWMSTVSQSACRRRAKRAVATGGGGRAALPSSATPWTANGRR